MKAKEYFEKYEKPIMDELGTTGIESIRGLVLEMSKEVEVICEKRNTSHDKAAAAVIKEMNDKWNAIVNLFEKKYGASPLKRDGFKFYWINEIPELEKIL